MCSKSPRMRLPGIIARVGRETGKRVQPFILHQEQAQAEDRASSCVQPRYLLSQHAIECAGHYAERIEVAREI